MLVFTPLAKKLHFLHIAPFQSNQKHDGVLLLHFFYVMMECFSPYDTHCHQL